MLTSGPSHYHLLPGSLPLSPNRSHSFCPFSLSLFSTQNHNDLLIFNSDPSLLCSEVSSLRVKAEDFLASYEALHDVVSTTSISQLISDLFALAIISFLLFLIWPCTRLPLSHCPCFLCLKHFFNKFFIWFLHFPSSLTNFCLIRESILDQFTSKWNPSIHFTFCFTLILPFFP